MPNNRDPRLQRKKPRICFVKNGFFCTVQAFFVDPTGGVAGFLHLNSDMVADCQSTTSDTTSC
jgi:hypothetical protein